MDLFIALQNVLRYVVSLLQRSLALFAEAALTIAPGLSTFNQIVYDAIGIKH